MTQHQTHAGAGVAQEDDEEDFTGLYEWNGKEWIKVGWIPVGERLPKEGEWVIIYSPRSLEPPMPAYLGHTSNGKALCWWQGADAWLDMLDWATHWMPLPAPPAEVQSID
jgi:hypothetical protein